VRRILTAEDAEVGRRKAVRQRPEGTQMNAERADQEHPFSLLVYSVPFVAKGISFVCFVVELAIPEFARIELPGD
jgi:hypothetical protein